MWRSRPRYMAASPLIFWGEWFTADLTAYIPSSILRLLSHSGGRSSAFRQGDCSESLSVLSCLHTVGPTGIHACGGDFGSRHDSVRPSWTRPGRQWSAQESPGFSPGEGQRPHSCMRHGRHMFTPPEESRGPGYVGALSRRHQGEIARGQAFHAA